MTHDRPPLTSHSQPVLHYPLRDNFTKHFSPPPADRILYLFSGWHFLNFIERSSFLGPSACFLWVPYWSSYQLAPLVHLTDWHYWASGISFWHFFSSGDGEMSQVRKLLTSSSPQQLSGWLSSKFCPHNRQ